MAGHFSFWIYDADMLQAVQPSEGETPNDRVIYEGTALKFTGVMSIDDWSALSPTLVKMSNGVNWWLGDWYLYGESAFGESAPQALPDQSWSLKTIQKAAWVCGAIESGRRRADLSFSHHQVVAKLDPDDQDHWLDVAASDGLSVRDLDREIKEELADADNEDSGPTEDEVEDFNVALRRVMNKAPDFVGAQAVSLLGGVDATAWASSFLENVREFARSASIDKEVNKVESEIAGKARQRSGEESAEAMLTLLDGGADD